MSSPYMVLPGLSLTFSVCSIVWSNMFLFRLPTTPQGDSSVMPQLNLTLTSNLNFKHAEQYNRNSKIHCRMNHKNSIYLRNRSHVSFEVNEGKVPNILLYNKMAYWDSSWCTSEGGAFDPPMISRCRWGRAETPVCCKCDMSINQTVGTPADKVIFSFSN